MENPSKKIKLEPKNDFENSSESQQENFLLHQKVKKDPEGNFLFLPFESPKMPKSIKSEVTKKEIKGNGRKLTKFSKHQCHICQKYLCNKKALKHHIERHFQPSSFECKRCKKNFELKWRFDSHKCVKESERHFCSFCEKNLVSYYVLRKHMKNFHADKLKDDLFYCDFCDEKLYKGKLKVHLESSKCKNRKIFTCDHCGKEFGKKAKICEHLQVHTVFKTECEICHTQVKSLKNHMRSVHSQQRFSCAICKKTFTNLKLLERHQKWHDSNRFQCQFCTLKFKLKGQLNYHMKFHENPDQFKCQVCGHQAKAKNRLKKHLKTHAKNQERI
jgi:KRAB domain-containing zinc finger protein